MIIITIKFFLFLIVRYITIYNIKMNINDGIGNVIHNIFILLAILFVISNVYITLLYIGTSFGIIHVMILNGNTITLTNGIINRFKKIEKAFI